MRPSVRRCSTLSVLAVGRARGYLGAGATATRTAGACPCSRWLSRRGRIACCLGCGIIEQFGPAGHFSQQQTCSAAPFCPSSQAPSSKVRRHRSAFTWAMRVSISAFRFLCSSVAPSESSRTVAAWSASLGATTSFAGMRPAPFSKTVRKMDRQTRP